jgi:hypothetical protein
MANSTTVVEPPVELPVELLVEEAALPDKLTVKNIFKASLHLTYGEIKPGETGECSKAEYENFAGTYLEKV